MKDLRASLRELGSELIVRVGRPETVLEMLAAATGASACYTHQEVTTEDVKVRGRAPLPGGFGQRLVQWCMGDTAAVATARGGSSPSAEHRCSRARFCRVLATVLPCVQVWSRLCAISVKSAQKDTRRIPRRQMHKSVTVSRR